MGDIGVLGWGMRGHRPVTALAGSAARRATAHGSLAENVHRVPRARALSRLVDDALRDLTVWLADWISWSSACSSVVVCAVATIVSNVWWPSWSRRELCVVCSLTVSVCCLAGDALSSKKAIAAPKSRTARSG